MPSKNGLMWVSVDPRQPIAGRSGFVHHGLVELGMLGGKPHESADAVGEGRLEIGDAGLRQVVWKHTVECLPQQPEEVVHGGHPEGLLGFEVVVDLGLVGLDTQRDRRVEAPSKPLAPNSTSADSRRASRMSALALRVRTLGGVVPLRPIGSAQYFYYQSITRGLA